MRILVSLIFVSIFCLTSNTALAQEEPKYNIEFVKAKWFGTADSNTVAAVFYVSPKKNKDFRPVLSMKVTYSANDAVETIVDVMKQKVPLPVQFVIYGQNVEEKNPAIYQMVKNKITGRMSNKNEPFFIAIYFNNLWKQKPEKMSVTYGLWEKRDLNERIEKKYDFLVE
jgi:hypothetical protein